MSTLDARKNFSIAQVSAGYAAGDTSIALASGKGALFPQPSTDGEFNVVWWNFTDYPSPADDPNVEVVRVTARTTDTLTVTRAQEGTSASAKNTAAKVYKMILAPTAKMITDIETLLDAKESTANKGIANGYAPLGADAKIASAYLPAIAITDTFVVTSQVEMLALTAQTGDVAVRTDQGRTYILQGTDPTILGNWVWMQTPTDTVLSVNGQTGVVVLTTNLVAEAGGVLYYTNARAIASTLTGYTSGAGTITSSDTVLGAIQKLNGNIAALVTGVSSVTGTTNRITATPTTGAVIVDISSSYVGQASITTLGTIATGVWQGTIIGGTYINFNSTNLKVTSSQLNTIQDIATSSTPQFARIGIGTSAGATTEQTLLQPVRTSGSPTMVTWTSGAHTTLATTAEATVVDFNFSASTQWATGTVPLQRTMRIQGQTITAVAATTFTSVQTLNIGLPVAGTNATFTNSYGLVVGTPNDFINSMVNFGGPLNGFYQVSAQNTSSGTLASTDFVAQNNTSTNGTNFVDMGITSSTFADPNYTAWGGANSAYLFAESASLNFATQRAGTNMNFFTGGTLTANLRATLSDTNLAFVSTMQIRGTGTNAAPMYADSTGVAGMSATSTLINFQIGAVTRWTISSTTITGGSTGFLVNRSAGTDGLTYTIATDTNTGIGGPGSDVLNLITGGVKAIAIDASQRSGFGIASGSITATVHIKAGTTSANSAPLKFTSGTNMTTAEAGAFEYDGTNLFFTRAGTTRENVLVAVDNASAPSTTATPTFTSYYGGNTKALGDPNRWMSVNILGTVYKVPMYT